MTPNPLPSSITTCPPPDADRATMERLDRFRWVPDPTRPVAQLSQNIPSKGAK